MKKEEKDKKVKDIEVEESKSGDNNYIKAKSKNNC